MSTSIVRPEVHPFFDADSGTFTYVVREPGGQAAIIDPVLDFSVPAATVSTRSADAIAAFVREHALNLRWILETHAHADHLSAGAYLRDLFGAQLVIGRGIREVQKRFKMLFGLDDSFATDGSQFDRLVDDGDALPLGEIAVRVMATPGHTDDSVTYVIGDAAFIGDTMFAPDGGSARCDFPGGSSKKLYASIQRIYSLPTETRIFLCHDYPPATRQATAETSIAAERAGNTHVKAGVTEADFVAMRDARDAKLAPPRLILPALQVNIRGGRLPEPDKNGIAYLRLPVNQLGAKA
jgi:glyoxylase-like metal-dependent hydrolase (beta-lactamase superfamily II)